MTPFHVGMKVVCVDDTWSRKPEGDEITPDFGGIYTIRNMEPHGLIEGRIQLSFLEILNPKLYYEGAGLCECNFNSANFRPAHENRMDELRTLLAPVPSKELVQS